MNPDIGFANLPNVSIQQQQPFDSREIPQSQLVTSPGILKIPPKKENLYILSEKANTHYHFIRLEIEVFSVPSADTTRTFMQLRLDPNMFMSNKGATSLKRFEDDSEEGFFIPSLKIKLSDELIQKYFKQMQKIDKSLLQSYGIDLEQITLNPQTLRSSKIELFTKKSKLAMFLTSIDKEFEVNIESKDLFVYRKLIEQIRWEPIFIITTFFNVLLKSNDLEKILENNNIMFLLFLILNHRTNKNTYFIPDDENESLENKTVNTLTFQNPYPLIYNFIDMKDTKNEKDQQFLACKPMSYPYKLSFDEKEPCEYYQSIKNTDFINKNELKALYTQRVTKSLRETRHLSMEINSIENELNKFTEFKYLKDFQKQFSHSELDIKKILIAHQLYENVIKNYKKDSEKNTTTKSGFTYWSKMRTKIFEHMTLLFDPNNEVVNSKYKIHLLSFPSPRKIENENETYSKLFMTEHFPLFAMNFTLHNIDQQNTDENHDILVDYMLSQFNIHYHFSQNQRNLSQIPLNPNQKIDEIWMLYEGYNKPFFINEMNEKQKYYYPNIFRTKLEFLIQNNPNIQKSDAKSDKYPDINNKNDIRVIRKIKENQANSNTVNDYPGLLDGFMFLQYPDHEIDVCKIDNINAGKHVPQKTFKSENYSYLHDIQKQATFGSSIESLVAHLNKKYEKRPPYQLKIQIPNCFIQKYKFVSYQLLLNYFYYRNTSQMLNPTDFEHFYDNKKNPIASLTEKPYLSKIFNYKCDDYDQKYLFHQRFDKDANHPYIYHYLICRKIEESMDKIQNIDNYRKILSRYIFDRTFKEKDVNGKYLFKPNERYTNLRVNNTSYANKTNNPVFGDNQNLPFIKNSANENVGIYGTHALPHCLNKNILKQVSYLYEYFLKVSKNNKKKVFDMIYRIIRYGINANFYNTFNTGIVENGESTVYSGVNAVDRNSRDNNINDVNIDVDTGTTVKDSRMNPSINTSVNGIGNSTKVFIEQTDKNINFIAKKIEEQNIPDILLNDEEYDGSKYKRLHSSYKEYRLHPFLIFDYLNTENYKDEEGEYISIIWLYSILYHLKNSYMYLLVSYYFLDKMEYVNDFHSVSEYYLNAKIYERIRELDGGQTELKVSYNKENGTGFFTIEMMETIIRNTMRELIMNFMDKHVLETFYKRKEKANDEYAYSYKLYETLITLLDENKVQSIQTRQQTEIKDNIIDHYLFHDKMLNNVNTKDDSLFIEEKGDGMLFMMDHMKVLKENMNTSVNNIALKVNVPKNKYHSDCYEINKLRKYFRINKSNATIISLKTDLLKELLKIENLDRVSMIMSIFNMDKKRDMLDQFMKLHDKNNEKCNVLIKEEIQKKKRLLDESKEKLKNDEIRDELRRELREKEEKFKNEIIELKQLQRTTTKNDFFVIKTSFMYHGVHEYIKMYMVHIKSIMEMLKQQMQDRAQDVDEVKMQNINIILDEYNKTIIDEQIINLMVRMSDIKDILKRFNGLVEKDSSDNQNLQRMFDMITTRAKQGDTIDRMIEEEIDENKERNKILYHNLYYVLNLLFNNNGFVWVGDDGMRNSTKLLLRTNVGKICEEYNFQKDKFACSLDEEKGVIRIKILSKFYDGDQSVGLIENISSQRGEVCNDAKKTIKNQVGLLGENIVTSWNSILRQYGFRD